MAKLHINDFTTEFLSWTLQSLNNNGTHPLSLLQAGFQSKIKNRMANRVPVDPDETAHCEPSHLDLHFLHRFGLPG